MRILYDGKIYADLVAGGIIRYFNNLINRLPNNFYPAMTILTNCHDSEISYPIHPNLKKVEYARFGFQPGRLSYWLEKHYYRSVTAFNYFDVIHPTYYSLLNRQELSYYKYPVVLTVWDMLHEIFPKELDSDGMFSKQKEKAIRAAQKIICISENTKKDLIEIYAIAESKISVTLLASEIDASLSYGDEPVPSRPFYLYVGSRVSYKNFDGLLMAFAKVASVQPDIILCVVGGYFNQSEAKLIAELKLNDRIVQYNYPTDSHLAKLYRCSVALVYPSKYEGFGIPPLEAMSCRTPAIACNCSSIPEVVGDAGLLFDPESISELADMMLFLLDNSLERDRLIAKGYERAKTFSWGKTVAQTIDVYRSVSIK
ncbi:glycosyltransferase family 4 protein [Floridanema aerugineum]|uniref:Glycosyltransferase family 4 protein n=1 Tax=Floridaenema aerugineum BLCC-F46 TaxID=3153654 RepID=A0ABV4X4X5_9CYAN